MQVYHKVQSHILSNINGHEKERNAMYDSIEGYKGDIRVNNYRRNLTKKEVKKILFSNKDQQDQQDLKDQQKKKKR